MLTDNKAKLIEPELSYQVVGCAYQAFNELGFGFQEKYYQRSFANMLGRSGLTFRREVSKAVTLKDGTIIGRYFIDFVIAERIVVEWKVANEFFDTHINQVLAYLKSASYRLGMIFLVTRKGIKVKRLVN